MERSVSKEARFRERKDRRKEYANERFFFSSRRRHTRSASDWSSDVCYSDLTTISSTFGFEKLPDSTNFEKFRRLRASGDFQRVFRRRRSVADDLIIIYGRKNGRASCMEGV